MKRFVRDVVYFAFSMILLAPLAFGQESSTAGRIELSPYVSGTLGFPGASVVAGPICAPTPSNCNALYNLGKKSLVAFGGTVAYSITKWLWVYGDYVYGLPDRETAHVTFSYPGYLTATDTTTGYQRFWKAGGGFQFTFPTVHRFVPYFNLGADTLHNDYSWSTTLVNGTCSGCSPISVRASMFTPQIGGGIRWYVGSGARNGFRIGVNGYYLSKGVEQEVVASSPGSFDYVRRRGYGEVTLAFFHQFGK